MRAVDGYLKGAQVWLDVNGDNLLTVGEPPAVTDGTGKATLDVTSVDNPAKYRVLVKAIVDQTTDVGDGTGTPKKVTKTFTMAAPAGVSTVTPLTTLVAQQMEADTGMTQEQAAQEVATQLGLGADKAADLLKDFIAEKNSTGQVYALNIVAALPEVLDDTKADALLAQGGNIGKALEEYLAQNPLDDETKPDDIKVVIGDDGSVDDVIKDSDGDGKDDDDVPPVPSDTLASFLLSASDMYMAGDGGVDELWADHWQSLGNGTFGWKESNILIGKTQYKVDTSMRDLSYRLTDAGWTEVSGDEDMQLDGNSDGSVSLTDIGGVGKLTGSCQDVGGKTLASVVADITASTQVVDSSATFSPGALGCEVIYTAMATDANYRIDTWTHSENSVNVNGVRATTLSELFSSSAPVASGPNAIGTVFDKAIDTWSESYGDVRLVLVRATANATSGVAQLWQYNANVQGYQLLSDVTPENHQGWTLQTLHGVTLLTFSAAIEQYLNQGHDHMRVGLTEWQGRVQWVDNSDGANGETMLFMNKVAYDDLFKGRTLVTDGDADNGDGETTPADAFADFITSGQLSYSLYQEGDVLGITQLGGSTYQTYELDYSTEPLQVASVADNGSITITRDGSNTVTFTTSLGSSTSVGTEVRDLNGALIKDLLAGVTQSANLVTMQAALGTATFGSGAKAYITIHTDEGGQSIGIVLNQTAYEQFLTAVAEANNSDPGTVTGSDAAAAFADLITSKATVYSLYGEQGNLGITKVTNANQFMPYVFDYSSNQLLVDEAHLGTGELVVNDDDSVSLMVANEQGVLELDGVIRCTQVLVLDAMPIKTLLAQVTDPEQKAAMEAKFATATFSAGAKAYINTHSYDDASSDVEVVLNETAYQDLLAIMNKPA